MSAIKDALQLRACFQRVAEAVALREEAAGRVLESDRRRLTQRADGILEDCEDGLKAYLAKVRAGRA